MADLLKLRANYRESIHHLQSNLPEDSEEINGVVHKGDITDYLHRRRVQNGLNDLRVAYDFLGLRQGEKIPSEWLEGLDDRERLVFLNHFRDMHGYFIIAQKLGLEHKTVEKIFKSSLQKVMKNVGRD